LSSGSTKRFDKTYFSCDAGGALEPGMELPLPEHAHDLKILKRGVGGFHQLKAERGFDQTLELAVIGFDDVVEVFGHTVPGVVQNWGYQCA
jgi:hypothetical protein